MVNRLVQKYPNYVFIKIKTNSKDITNIKDKYMALRTTSVQQFLHFVRFKDITLLSKNATLLMFVDNKIPRLTDDLGTLYEKYKDNHGLLHIQIETESVFGNQISFRV